MNQCARTIAGENFDEHGMRHPAIEDNGGFRPAFNRRYASFKLGDHPACDCAVGLQRRDFGGIEISQQNAVLIQHARDIGEQE